MVKTFVCSQYGKWKLTAFDFFSNLANLTPNYFIETAFYFALYKNFKKLLLLFYAMPTAALYKMY